MALNTGTSAPAKLSLSGKTKEELLEAELEALAEEALEADMEFKAAEAKKDAAKKRLKDALEKAGKLDKDTKAIGVVRTIIKETKRFDPELAKAQLTKKLIAECSTISGTLVKAKVTPAQYEAMQSPQGYSLELKPNTNV